MTDGAELKPGQQLASTVCETRVVVVRADRSGASVTCGGAGMVPVEAAAAPAGEASPGHDGGSTIGKRYVDDDATVELLCTKSGAGSLAVGGRVLHMKDAKPLPSSD